MKRFVGKRVWAATGGLAAAGVAAWLLFPSHGLSQRRPVGPWLDGALPSTLPVLGRWRAVPAFPDLEFKDAVGLVPVPRSDRLAVHTRQGQVWTFENQRRVRGKRLLLDLSARCQGWDDCGLLGLAFHPDFGKPDSPNRRFVYVWYQHSPSPTQGPGRPTLPFPPITNRLARFTAPEGFEEIDRGSEVVLIDQKDESVLHGGGGMFFHPEDGFLYLSVGDEGYLGEHQGVGFGNEQRIDRDLFSGVLRIDVDRDPRRSHPIRRQPAKGRTDHYFIPNDNPWVGVPEALEEFYAIGLRSPHRMTYDPVGKKIWACDVGGIHWEEVNVIERGGNYQWNYREGPQQFLPRPSVLLGEEKPPYHAYNRSEGWGVIGGYVYRGRRFQRDLWGKYILGDVNGTVWALDADPGARADPVPLCRLPAAPNESWGAALSSFGLDQEGEIYMVQMGDAGRIYSLEPARDSAPPPPGLLSETGAFRSVRTLEPSPALVPYEVNVPFWSDGAEKRRWIAVPNDGPPYGPGERVGFSAEGEWSFPPGTVFVKHFELPIDEADPARVRRLETRLLVRDREGGVYGLTYRWREDGSDAELLEGRREESIPVLTSGGRTDRSWFYPGRQDCLTCHTGAAGHVLGVNTRQMNREFAYPSSGVADNQIRAWGHAGLLEGAPGAPKVADLPRLVPTQDERLPVEARARSYLDANCSGCHRPNGVRAYFDGRSSTRSEHQALIHGPLLSEGPGPGRELVVPGEPERSALYLRLASEDGAFRMPPVGRLRMDPQGEDLIKRWIRSMALTTPVSPVRGNGTGLRAEYFEDADLARTKLVRTDPSIDFDWGAESPAPSIPPDNFSVRWSGWLEPRFTELTTLIAVADDGVRLWVDGRLVIDRWVEQGRGEHWVTLPLVAGRKVPVRMEMYEGTGRAMARLFWTSASLPREIIPSSHLTPANP